MGKISEALKKAGREDRVKTLELAEKVLTPDIGNDLPKNKERTGRYQANRAQALSKSVSAPKTGNTAGATKKETTVEKALPIGQVEGSLTPDGNDNNSIVLKNQESAIETDRSHKFDEHENSNVVMASVPKTTETISPVSPVKPSAKNENRTSEAVNALTAEPRREIQISYSKTKVQVSDPERLKNNKIFSMFDDIAITDQIKILRTQVLKKLNAISGNSILVTSANPYEGKTFTTINLGVSIAKEFNRTVLIIDADLRKPTKRHTAFATDFFTIDVDVGLTDYLKGEADIPDILINPGISKLTLIPSGAPVYNAPELINSSRMEEMMSEIKGRYASDRLVIVDGPAMLPFPDATILSRYVDGVLPVIEIEKTSTEDLKKMMDCLKGVQVLGTVLNKNKG
jgi:protein-tyrosine kinase